MPLLPSWISSIKQISISCRSFLTATFQFCYFGLGPKADFPCFYFAKIERETKGEYDEKKIVRAILSIGLFFLLLCGGIMLYTNRASGEVAGILDQLNPLVPKSEMYVKTQAPESVNGYGTAHYKQVAATADGQTRMIEFEGLQVLKTERF